MEHNGQVSVAVRVNDELRAVDTELPCNAVFPTYSITKTLTAICVLRLAERGLLPLGDSAGQWLPDVDVPAATTLTQLLRHTSGLRDYGPLPKTTKQCARILVNPGRHCSLLCSACSARGEQA